MNYYNRKSLLTVISATMFFLTSLSLTLPVRANSIINGDYAHENPDSYFIKIEKRKFRFYPDGDEAPSAWMPIAGTFQPIKKGVLFNSYDKKYYCLTTRSIGSPAICTRNGWKKS
jgi:hypothetical protein